MVRAQGTGDLLILVIVPTLDVAYLLGLELLVGANIISTITAPLTFDSVGLLAAIVGIRTFLSFSLETEIEGCWPWQRAAKDVGRSVIESER